uniref:Chitin-binding type-2 domain-containing protein n=1 Tax=Anopheles farauti TaxID=69004 RepID=A0A182QJQ9_9DIPT
MKYVAVGLLLSAGILAIPGDRIPNHPNCSDNQSYIPDYFPHPTNCSRFYECRQKDAWELECPPGLHFNPKLNVCDYPINAGCEAIDPEGGTTTRDPEVVVTTTSTQASTPVPTIESSPSTNVPTEASTPSSAQTTEASSTEFPPLTTTLTSESGTTHLPPSTTTLAPESGTTHLPPLTTTLSPESNVTPESTTPESTASPNCPPSGAHQPNYWPNEHDCSRYRGCLEGCTQEFKCPPGLYWNDRQKQCDSYSKADCSCPLIPPAPNVRQV